MSQTLFCSKETIVPDSFTLLFRLIKRKINLTGILLQLLIHSLTTLEIRERQFETETGRANEGDKTSKILFQYWPLFDRCRKRSRGEIEDRWQPDQPDHHRRN